MIDDFAQALSSFLRLIGDMLADDYPEVLITLFLIILAISVK